MLINHEVLYTFIRWVAQTFVPLMSHIFVAFKTFTLKLLNSYTNFNAIFQVMLMNSP